VRLLLLLLLHNLTLLVPCHLLLQQRSKVPITASVQQRYQQLQPLLGRQMLVCLQLIMQLHSHGGVPLGIQGSYQLPLSLVLPLPRQHSQLLLLLLLLRDAALATRCRLLLLRLHGLLPNRLL
jgi:hypothetical protein